MTEEKGIYGDVTISKRKRQKQIVIRATEKEFDQIKNKVEKSKLTQNKYLPPQLQLPTTPGLLLDVFPRPVEEK